MLAGTGTGTFGAKVDYPTGLGPRSVAAADVTGDGKPDLVVANTSAGTGTVSVLVNTGTGSFAAKVDYPAEYSVLSLALGDVDGDGKRDIVAANYDRASVSIFVNRGAGTFAPRVSYRVGQAVSSVALADVSGDGKLDIVTADGSRFSASVLLNRGPICAPEP